MSKYLRTAIEDKEIIRYILGFFKDEEIKELVFDYKMLKLKCGAFDEKKFVYDRKKVIENILSLVSNDKKIFEKIITEWGKKNIVYLDKYADLENADQFKVEYEKSALMTKMFILTGGLNSPKEDSMETCEELYEQFKKEVLELCPDFDSETGTECLLNYEKSDKTSTSKSDKSTLSKDDLMRELVTIGESDKHIDIYGMSIAEIQGLLLQLATENTALNKKVKYQEETFDKVISSGKNQDLIKEVKKDIKSIKAKIDVLEKTISVQKDSLEAISAKKSISENSIREVVSDIVKSEMSKVIKAMNERILDSQNSIKGAIIENVNKNSKATAIIIDELNKNQKELAKVLSEVKEMDSINSQAAPTMNDVFEVGKKTSRYNNDLLDSGIQGLLEQMR